MNMKIVLTCCLLGCINIFSNNVSFAEINNKLSLKEHSYKTITEALFDEKIHANMKMDIFSMINELLLGKKNVKDEKSLINDFFDELMRSPYKSSLAIDLFANTKDKTIKENETVVNVDSNIINILERALSSENENMVLYALDVIGKSKIKELVPVLIDKLTKLEPENVNLEVAIITTIGEIGEESSVETLKKYLESDELKVKLNTVQALGDIKTDETVEILKGYLNSDSLEMALLSAGILAQDGNQEAVNLLIDGAKSPVMLTKQKTLIAMTNVTNPAILPALREAMNTDNEVIKAYTLEILSNINAPETVEVINLVVDDEKFTPRALIALSKNTSNEAFTLLEEKVKSKEKLVKSYTVAVLSQIKDKKVIPILKIALNDKNEAVKLAAAKILLTLEDESGLDYLKDAVQNPDDEISLSAAAFLGFMDIDSGKEVLREALTNTDLPSWKRLDISIILENLGDETIMPSLKRLLEMQRPTTLPKDLSPKEKALLTLIKDESKWVQLNSASFMVLQKDETCLPVLEKLSYDSDILVRTTAIELMGELGLEKALPTLKKHLNDDSVRVRVNSAKSIIQIISNDSKKKVNEAASL